MTPIPAGSQPDNANTIPPPGQPIPETTPAPLCIAGQQYIYSGFGDDFTQETQAQFARYTTQWEINQFAYNGTKTNWLWSDQYSGIGRRNDYGFGDTYMVHIDDANPSRSFPNTWVNSISPRPGAQIVGTPPNAYLDIRAVAVPTQYVNDPSLNSAHWLTGGIQSPGFTFGYTESTVIMPSNDGAWPSAWTYQVPGGGGYDGTGTSPTNSWEIDTFEKFGNSQGTDIIQQTTNSGRTNAMFVRPTTPGSTVNWHTYGQLWVPPLLGKPAYIVFYVDRKPTSYYLAPTGLGNMNMMVNLQMGVPGSFVGTPDNTKVADLKVKSYFTWQLSGAPCDGIAQANPIPMPTPTAPPVPPPPVASNIVPKLMPLFPPTLVNDSKVHLAAAPANGSLLIAQGISNYAICPTGFATIQSGVTWFCTAIVGQNGVTSQMDYTIGGAGFDRGAIVEIQNVSGFTVNPSTSTGWHSEPVPSLTRTQTAPGPNELVLAFGYGITDSPRYTTAQSYASNIGFYVLYNTPADSNYGRGMAMLEGRDDPFTAPGNNVSFTGTYTWTGPPEVQGNDLFPQIVTVLVR